MIYDTPPYVPDVSCFESQKDKEIVLIVYAWMIQNTPPCDISSKRYIKQFIKHTLSDKPFEFVKNYEKGNINKMHCVFRILSFKNFNNLMYRLKRVYTVYKSLENLVVIKTRKNSYPYIILAENMSGGTGWPTINSKCSFYAYHFLLYCFYKSGTWKNDMKRKCLLPCDDAVFYKAFENKETSKILSNNLHNTIVLTKKAKSKYGDNDFFKYIDSLFNVK